MKKNMSKALYVLLAMVLVFALMVPAMATTAQPEAMVIREVNGEFEASAYATLAEAIASCAGGETVVVEDTIFVNSPITIPVSINLNIGAHALIINTENDHAFKLADNVNVSFYSLDANATVTLNGVSYAGLVSLGNNSTVSLENIEVNGLTNVGIIAVRAGSTEAEIYMSDITVSTSGAVIKTSGAVGTDITIEDCLFKAFGKIYREDGVTSAALVLADDGTASGQTIVKNTTFTRQAGPVVKTSGAKVAFDGCSISVTDIVEELDECHSAALYVENNGFISVINSTVSSLSYGIYVAETGGGARFADGSIVSGEIGLIQMRANESGKIVEFSSGSYSGAFDVPGNSENILVNGGKFTHSPEEYLMPGYCVNEIGGDYPYEVTETPTTPTDPEEPEIVIPPVPTSYAITITGSEGGSAAAPSAATPGALIELELTPNKGYALSTLSVKTVTGQTVTITKNKTGNYTFIMPSAAVKIEVNFTLIPVNYDDVEQGKWYTEAVEMATRLGFMTGYPDNTFKPNGYVTRSMVMTVLARQNGVDTTTGKTWDEVGIDWAVENEVSDGTNPQVTITREQLVTMIWRSLGKPAATSTAGLDAFTDCGKVHLWAVDAMAWAIEVGLIEGLGDNVLDPYGYTTRAQLATVLVRLDAMDL